MVTERDKSAATARERLTHGEAGSKLYRATSSQCCAANTAFAGHRPLLPQAATANLRASSDYSSTTPSSQVADYRSTTPSSHR